MDIRERNRQVVSDFRSGGPIEGMHRERLVLLTTAGRRTGRSHTTPMGFVRDGERLLVFASANAAPDDPQWYRNLVADPHVTVEIDQDGRPQRYAALATTTEGADRERSYDLMRRASPYVDEHQAKVDRPIPIVALTRE